MTAYKGLGTYGNAVGVVTPLDHKLSNAAVLVKTTTPLVIRPGVFYAGNASLVTGTAGMAYSVAAYEIATQRSAAAGVVFGGNDGALSVATTAAPGSNSRWDVVYHWHREYSLDGVDSNPVIGVVQGTAAASPTVPSLAAFPGAVELARILVPAGVVATNSGTTFTQTAPFTSADGGRVPFRSTTEMNLWTTALDEQDAIDLSTLFRYRRTGGAWVRNNMEDTGWVTPTLLNSWVAFSGIYSTPKYKRLNGVVHIKGFVRSGTSPSTLFQLPVGMRPLEIQVYLGPSGTSTAYMNIDASGNVSVQGYNTGGSNANVGINFSFVAEQ